MVNDPRNQRGGIPTNPLQATLARQYAGAGSGMAPQRAAPAQPAPVLKPAVMPTRTPVTQTSQPNPQAAIAGTRAAAGQPQPAMPATNVAPVPTAAAAPAVPEIQTAAVGQPQTGEVNTTEAPDDFDDAWDWYSRAEEKLQQHIDQLAARGIEIPAERLAEMQAQIARMRDRRLGRMQGREQRMERRDGRIADRLEQMPPDAAARLAERRNALLNQGG